MSVDDTELVSRRGDRLAALLRATDPPVPAIAFPAERIARAARRRAAQRWRVAAGIVALAAVAVGVPPVRAWIVRAARAVWMVAAGPRRAIVAPPAAAPGAANRVTFTPGPGTFTLHVAGRQAGGSLIIESTADSAVSAAISEGSGAELVVLPDGLRIVNDAGATASCVVRVPAVVRRIVVTVGSAAPRVLAPSRPGQRWVVDLRAVR
jgi:hypothetical protein